MYWVAPIRDRRSTTSARAEQSRGEQRRKSKNNRREPELASRSDATRQHRNRTDGECCVQNILDLLYCLICTLEQLQRSDCADEMSKKQYYPDRYSVHILAQQCVRICDCFFGCVSFLLHFDLFTSHPLDSRLQYRVSRPLDVIAALRD